MIIDKPKITEGNDEICVSARVKIRASDRAFPNTLWFKFPKSYAEYVTDRADCFAKTLETLGSNLQNSIDNYFKLNRIQAWRGN